MDGQGETIARQCGNGTEIKEVQQQIASTVENPDHRPIEASEERSLGALLLVEQYTSLRSEIEKRIDIRQQILALTLLVAGTFLTIGVQPGVPAVVLLFYPLIAMFLAAIWEHNDLRVGQINFYIRTQVEKHMQVQGPGWETFRIQTFPSRNGRTHFHETKHPLIPRVGLIVFATRGMFFATQIIAILVAVVRSASELLQHSFSINTGAAGQIVISVAIGLLFLVDLGIVIYTFSVVQHKRA